MQPGLQAGDASEQQLDLLASTDAYLRTQSERRLLSGAVLERVEHLLRPLSLLKATMDGVLTVYLDQNKWIDLARAETEHPRGAASSMSWPPLR